MKEKRENQKENLVRAACDLARRAGVSVGTLHYCFATKGELLKALYDFIRTEFRASTEHFESGEQNVLDTLEGQARVRLHLLRSQDTVYQAWRAFFREAWTDPLVAQIVRAHFTEQRGRIEQVLAAGRANGSLPKASNVPDSVTAGLIIGFYEGLAVQWSLDPDCIDPDVYVQGLHQLLGVSDWEVVKK
jgi:AcrR family transcriptional regulator